jgi:hypothetical protein
MTGCLKHTDIDILLSAPEEIEIDGRKYILETSLNRDFMPTYPPNESRLTAGVSVIAVDSQPFPSSIDMNRLWVIKGRDYWETEFSGITRPTEPNNRHKLFGYAENGPRWQPRITVDVVVRIIDNNNQEYLLRTSGQEIHDSCK